MTLLLTVRDDAAFRASASFTLGPTVEGGFVDHPADRGGATSHGITLVTLQRQGPRGDLDGDGDVDGQDVREVTVDVAIDIAWRDYWLPGRCDQLAERSAELALAHFDAMYHHGPGTRGTPEAVKGRGHRYRIGAAHFLQRAARVQADGWIGPKTIAGVDARLAALGLEQFLRVLLEHRMAQFHRILALDPSQRVFRHGWRNRFNAVCQRVGIPPLWTLED